MTAILQTTQLRKVYKRLRGDEVVAVHGLDLTVGSPGTVHGFLGPNGSGKTTTIRCLLGLIRPTSGSARVFDADSTNEFHRVAPRVGAIVENPKMFPKFSGRKNLALLAQMSGTPKTNIDSVLDTVGLTGRGGDTFESYSLGMKQRLAIGAALLKDPDLLILDEPANGLDPAGIAEMRVLIRQIADSGKAVLVSSHQLAEIEQVCDEVTIIANGKLIQSGSVEEVRSTAGSERVLLTIDDRDGAAAVLVNAGLQVWAMPTPDELQIHVDSQYTSEVTRVLAEQGRYVRTLRIEQASLESAFLNLTGGMAGEVGPTATTTTATATTATATAGNGSAPPPQQPPPPSVDALPPPPVGHDGGEA